MDVIKTALVVAALSITLITVKIIIKIAKINLVAVKFASIDGLRGYLAFFVFLHHSVIWYSYLRNHLWVNPDSNLFTHFGQASVAMFFMITGFLFFSKLINSESKPIDWIQLFVSRIFRLVPLYYFTVVVILIIVGILSHFKVNEPINLLFKEIVIWGTFAIVGMDNVNGVDNTWLIIAGITWSLNYEWLFYFSLPFLGLLFFKSKPPVIILLISGVVLAVIMHYSQPLFIHISSFVGGIVASFLTKSEKFCSFATKKSSSLIVLLCLLFLVLFFHTARGYIPLFLVSIAFIIIACGNTMFGLLTHPVSRTLGQMAYSIYLLHGVVLFVMFKFIIGIEKAVKLSEMEHYLWILFAIPPLIIICYLTHIYIELPFMNLTPSFMVKIRKFYRGTYKLPSA